MGAGMESLTPSIFAEILAASTGDQTTGVMLDVRDYGEVRAADEVQVPNRHHSRNHIREKISFQEGREPKRLREKRECHSIPRSQD